MSPSLLFPPCLNLLSFLWPGLPAIAPAPPLSRIPLSSHGDCNLAHVITLLTSSRVFISHTLKPRILILTKTFFPSLTFQSWPYSVSSKDLLKYTAAFPLKIFVVFLLPAYPSLQSLMAHSDTFRFLIREAFPDLSKIITGPPISLAFPIPLTLPCFLSPHFILHIMCLLVISVFFNWM